MNINDIYLEFKDWIFGLIQDDPIPFEIKSLVFYINDNFEIGFSGSESEKIEKIDLFFYYPLEAEFFYNHEIYCEFFKNKDINFCLNVLKELITKLKKEDGFNTFNYFYGKLFSNSNKI